MAEKPQTFANHTRFDPLFHFFVIPIFAIAVIMSLIHFFNHLRRSGVHGNATPVTACVSCAFRQRQPG